MNTFKNLSIDAGRAICYSGFRDGQRPGQKCPSASEVLEDLLLLHKNWSYLRLYDCDEHAQTVLDVIIYNKLDFKIMLGAYIEAEQNNPNCPWHGGMHTQEQLLANMENNFKKMEKLTQMANQYSSIIFALSVGNEACVDWTDHLVSEDKVVQYVQYVKSRVKQPVTFCENYVPWVFGLNKLAEAVDFISIHSYPIWEHKIINDALDFTKENYDAVARKYPNKTIVFTEVGWATNSNGWVIKKENANEKNQQTYFNSLSEWVDKAQILSFYFEAFDESWKGSPDALEPEKHWGIFKTNRQPKMAANHLHKSLNETPN